MEFVATTTRAVTYGDWIFVNGIIVMILLFIMFSLFMSVFKTT